MLPSADMALKQPTAAQVRAAREAAGLTQAQAAELVHAASYRTWQNWEADERETEHRKMGLAEWDLFLRLTAKQRARR